MNSLTSQNVVEAVWELVDQTPRTFENAEPMDLARCGLFVAAKLLEDSAYELARTKKSVHTTTLLLTASRIERLLNSLELDDDNLPPLV